MSTPIAQHMTLRFEEDRVFASDPAAQRQLARIVLKQGRDSGLLSFGAPDTHLHVLPHCDRQQATELDRRLKIHIKKALHPGATFARTRYKDVFNEWHLFRSFRYDITQDRHHRCDVDPLFEATVLPDLLGLRLIDTFRTGAADAYVIANVASYLPRVNPGVLWGLFGNPRLDLPASDLAWSELEQAAAAAVGLPNLSGQTAAAIAASSAAVQLAESTLNRGVILDLLRCSESTYTRRRQNTVSPALQDAVKLQLQLRSGLALRRGSLSPGDQAWERAKHGQRGSGQPNMVESR